MKKKESIYEIPLNRAYMYSLYDPARAVDYDKDNLQPFRFRYFDENNNLIKEESFSGGRLRMTHERRYEKVKDKYNIIEETISYIETDTVETIQYLYEGDKVEVVKRMEGEYVSKMERALRPDGTVKHEIEVDYDGDVIYEAKYDEENRMIYKKEMNAEFFFTYNEEGDMILKREYTADGNEIREELTYSEGKLSEISFFEDDKLVAKERNTFDDKERIGTTISEDHEGNLLEEDFFKEDENGNLLLLEDYVYNGGKKILQRKEEYGYDSEGRVIKIVTEYKTFRDTQESAMVEVKYKDDGSIKEVLTSNRIYNEFDRDAYYLIEEN